MGVAGSGKTTVATAVGEALGWVVIEGDDHHPPENVEKMAAGIPLTDEDRRPWLEALAALVRDHHQRGESTVLACSALRRSYRDILRTAAPDETFIVHLAADPDILRERMRARTGHFMPVDLLESQLATLEPLEPDEAGATIDAARPADEVIAKAVAAVTQVTR
jgi:gluconokinase